MAKCIEPTCYTKLCVVFKNDPEHNHVLFIDEITNVKEIEQSLVYNLVLEHSIEGGKGKLPDNCVVIAAGNSQDESTAAYGMPEPLFRRFEAHIDLNLDLPSWLEWGSELNKDGNSNIHPLVSAFVSANADKVFYTSYDPDKPPKFAIDPRGWEQISNIIYKNKGVIRQKLIADKVGEDIATAFIDFVKIAHISINDIVNGTYKKGNIPKSFNEKYALVCELRKADESQVEKVREFIGNELGEELLSTFDSLWVGEDDEKALLIDELEKKRIEEKEQKETKLEEKMRKEAQIKQQGSQKRSKKNYKITVDEFWASKNKLAIHTPTEEQAKTLCKVFEKMGKKWNDGASYEEFVEWEWFKSAMCYTNKNECSDKLVAENSGYTTYEFDEVDIEKYLDKPKSKYKITVDEFWASKDILVIHTPTPEQAETLCKVFDKMGKKWYGGNSYLDENYWYRYDNRTCYGNKGFYGNYTEYAKVYEFDEVDLSKYLEDENEEEM